VVVGGTVRRRDKLSKPVRSLVLLGAWAALSLVIEGDGRAAARDEPAAEAAPELAAVRDPGEPTVLEHLDVVAAAAADHGPNPISAAATSISPRATVAPAATISELLGGVPAVAENGQAGLFQTVSIRGVGRQRVLTLVAGVPMHSERRAGVSASFLDPLLMESVDVVRGPLSTSFGSGALGGVLQVSPRSFAGIELATGWSDFGNETHQQIGVGLGAWSLGIVRRAANDAMASDGSEQNTGFSQHSAALQRHWRIGDRRLHLLVAPSVGRDLGRPTREYPALRVVGHPKEEHLIVRLALDHADWRVTTFAHPNRLQTETERPEQSLTEVDGRAFDLGMSGQRNWRLGPTASVRGGIDWLARRSVSSVQTEKDLSTGIETRRRPLDGARQDEIAAHGSVTWSPGRSTLQAGGRSTWHWQESAPFGPRNEHAWSGFVGLVHPLGRGVEATANLGSGLRFPSLSERFFSGATARGGVLGNPSLSPERSLGADLGVRWFGGRTFATVSVFHQEIDGFIERIDLAPGLRSFANLHTGTIRGIELEGRHRLTGDWSLAWSGARVTGRTEERRPLSDVPGDRGQLLLEYRGARLGVRCSWQHRTAMRKPGPGEQAIGSADLLAASVSWQLPGDLELRIHGRNLLDEVYMSAADELAAAAPGRTLGVSMTWSR
jgi:outer membrane receptor protein involved in Fe transport